MTHIIIPASNKPKKTLKNPYQLPVKDLLTIELIEKQIQDTGKVNIKEAIRLVRNLSTPASVRETVSTRLKNVDFRRALVDQLSRAGLVGQNGKVGQQLAEGMGAETKIRDKDGEVITIEKDHKTRLEYIKEINKITGVYAAEKKETRRMNLNIDLSKEEIEELRREVND
jgi:hypothetical protein